MQNGCCEIYYFSFKCNVLYSFWLITGISASILVFYIDAKDFFFPDNESLFPKISYVLYSLIQDASRSWRELGAGIHQQQMEGNCSEGVPRQWGIWGLHYELGCLFSLRSTSWLWWGYMLSLVYFISYSSKLGNNVMTLWRLKPELKLQLFPFWLRTQWPLQVAKWHQRSLALLGRKA